MCGIIGYIGKRNRALPILIDGLKSLEYRGYDSAGVAYLKNGCVEIVKSLGGIENLEKRLSMDEECNVGIGHTRWATHGVPNEVNSHPHKSGKVTLVHNGIIENYIELKEELSKKARSFVSDTDSEVGAALLDFLYEECGDMTEAIEKFKKRVRGSYALAILVDGIEDRIYVVKNLSPLIIGIGEDENYIASDVPAILAKTNRYVTLEDGEYAEVKRDMVSIYDKSGNLKNVEEKIFKGDAASLEKGDFEHFMQKEIYEEPSVVRRIWDEYLSKLDTLPDLRKYKSVTIVGCGSAMHAGLVGKAYIEKYLDIPVVVEVASEFKYKKSFIGKGDVVILVSQSGETADTLSSLKLAREKGAHTIGIVNVVESSIAREADEVIYTLAGSEIAVATTKAYLAQTIILFLLAIRGNEIDRQMLKKIPTAIEMLIGGLKLYTKIATSIKDHDDIFFIGRGIDYAICMEGSLKLKEISYVHSEAYPAGELKHGTISLITDGTPVFAIMTDKNLFLKTISNVKEVKARGARVTIIVSEETFLEGDYYDEVIRIPNTLCDMEAILSIVPLQLVAYEVAKMRGCSIDKPRNLAKSVTVE